MGKWMKRESVNIKTTLDPETGDLIITADGEWTTNETTIPATGLDFYQKQSAAIRASLPSSPRSVEEK